jgi:hypothetical protein
MGHMATDELSELQDEYRGLWHIFRSQRNGEPASWCASLRTPAAGVDPTVIRDTARELRAALVEQRELAESDVQPYDVATEDHYPDA